MRYIGRGQTTFVDVPDQPATTTSPTGAVARGADAPADSHVTPDLGFGRADGTAPILTLTGTHIDTPAQVTPVASAVADLPQPTATHSDMTDSSSADGGAVGRGSDLASLDSGASSYADHGWFIVPSADNEYGPAVYAAADDFGWSDTAGAFAADWFIA